MKTINKLLLCAILLVAGAMQGIRAQLPAYDYIERSWDEENLEVKSEIKTCTSYTPINGNDTSDSGWVGLYDGWYVVTGNSAFKVLNVLGTDVHLIIPDGVTITVTGGVKLKWGHKLTIYSQGGDAGLLNSINYIYDDAAGIGSGGLDDGPAGLLVVHGGTINATGNEDGAGIGGCKQQGFYPNLNYGGLIVYGGNITATSSSGGAGIGSGTECEAVAGYITIYGGTVKATGGDGNDGLHDGFGGAAIGGGDKSPGAFLDIWGGTVNAVVAVTNNSGAAAIGGGCYAAGTKTHIHGGTVTAKAKRGAAIGGGYKEVAGGEIIIDGGMVYATTVGDDAGAGIGCGRMGTSATITITGGTVTATSGGDGAGIGGGDFSYPDLYITISGGTVTASGTAGIGSGVDAFQKPFNFYGTLNITGGTVYALGKMYAVGGTNAAEHMTIYDSAMVHYGSNAESTSLSNVADRISACVNNKFIAIERCTHSGAAYENNLNGTHDVTCQWCKGETEVHTYTDGICLCQAIRVDLADNASNATLLADIEGKTGTVTFVGRTLYKDGAWNTICLPFSLSRLTGSPLEGATVKTLDSAVFADGTLTLNFTPHQYEIEAGKPYIVKWEAADDEEDVVDPTFTYVTINAASADVATDAVTFKGFFSPCSFEGEDKSALFLGDNNTLYYPDAAMTIGSCRAYFKLSESLAGELAAGVKSVRLNFPDDEATAIQFVPSADGSDDRWNSSTGRWYAIDGRALNARPTLPGLYIHNGRKVMVK